MEELIKMHGEIILAGFVTAVIIGVIMGTVFFAGPLHNLILNVVNAAS